MKVLALITARGGSKRLPGKNIRLLGGKPLIVWTIDAAIGIPGISDVLVSTDNEEIALISRAAGAYVPWLRPSSLATDTASSVSVAKHALDWYELENGPVDGLLLLQPTSPFRTRGTIIKGIDLYIKHNKTTVVSVSVSDNKSNSLLVINNGYLSPITIRASQEDCCYKYAINGCFYLISPEILRKEESFLGKKTMPLLIKSRKEAIDIDTEDDWSFAVSSLDDIS
jgi:CMP-N,N'-diacetyllegionaminic acid synthase